MGIGNWKTGKDWRGDTYYFVEEAEQDEEGEIMEGKFIERNTAYIALTPEYHTKQGAKKWAVALSYYDSPPSFVNDFNTKKEAQKALTKFVRENPRGFE